jgi:glycosyltransferase involved in cell wall biosynthesis
MYRNGYDVELHLFDTMTPGSPDPRIGFDPGLPFRYYMNLGQEHMAGMYGAADVFVSAEHRAGWNNTAAEAAACGLPLVCTSSGTEDFAEHGRSALVVPLRSAYFFRKALVKLYHNRTIAPRLGAEAQRRILAFTWSEVCERMERRFQELLAAR